MRRDLDRLMQQSGLAGLVVLANDRYCPAMHYCTGEMIQHGVYFRGADGRAHLVHDAMERDQASRAGCETSEFSQHRFNELLEQEGGAPEAIGRLIGDLSAQLGMKGAVAFYGPLDLGPAYRVIQRALAAHPAMTLDKSSADPISAARMTKDAAEIEAIRSAGKGCEAALLRLRDFLRGLKPDGEHFRSNGGGPVRLGDLRRLIQEEYLRHGLAESGETIVSQGRDAGVPHNRGNDEELLRRGAPVILDLFPARAGGGYHFDVTRTFCVGPASAELRKLFRDVEDALKLALDALRVGEPCRSYQERVWDLFESRGHATLRQNPSVHEGYIHGLGHGVGLDVHEAPRLGGPPSNTQPLEPGMVITVEPGLYYPSRGMGVRLEDLVWVREDGTVENLTHFPYDLEVMAQG